MTKRQGRRRKLLLVDFKETRGYWELKEETPDYTLWGSRFERGYGLVVRHCGVSEFLNILTESFIS